VQILLRGGSFCNFFLQGLRKWVKCVKLIINIFFYFFQACTTVTSNQRVNGEDPQMEDSPQAIKERMSPQVSKLIPPHPKSGIFL
jgi:hypothetical protein